MGTTMNGSHFDTFVRALPRIEHAAVTRAGFRRTGRRDRIGAFRRGGGRSEETVHTMPEAQEGQEQEETAGRGGPSWRDVSGRELCCRSGAPRTPQAPANTCVATACPDPGICKVRACVDNVCAPGERPTTPAAAAMTSAGWNLLSLPASELLRCLPYPNAMAVVPVGATSGASYRARLLWPVVL